MKMMNSAIERMNAEMSASIRGALLLLATASFIMMMSIFFL